MSDLPVDETWIVIGIFILAIAAISQLHRMWREARFSYGDDDDSPNAPSAERYIEAWESAAESEGLQTRPTEDPLSASRIGGRLSGLPARIEMELQPSGGRKLNPDAINPATVRCRISARVELAFPWREATVRKFVLPKFVKKETTDNVDISLKLPENTHVQGVRMNRQARTAISDMTDEFESVKVIDGTLIVVDSVYPPRVTAQWADLFGEWIRGIRRRARTLSGAGLSLRLQSSLADREIQLRLEPDAGLPRRKCRVIVESKTENSSGAESLRARLQDTGVVIEELQVADGRLRLQAVVDREDEDIIGRLVLMLAD